MEWLAPYNIDDPVIESRSVLPPARAAGRRRAIPSGILLLRRLLRHGARAGAALAKGLR